MRSPRYRAHQRTGSIPSTPRTGLSRHLAGSSRQPMQGITWDPHPFADRQYRASPSSFTSPCRRFRPGQSASSSPCARSEQRSVTWNSESASISRVGSRQWWAPPSNAVSTVQVVKFAAWPSPRARSELRTSSNDGHSWVDQARDEFHPGSRSRLHQQPRLALPLDNGEARANDGTAV